MVLVFLSDELEWNFYQLLIIQLFVLQWRGITDTEYTTTQEIIWIYSFCAEKGAKEDTQGLKFFKSYMDDILCTFMGNPLDYLEYANSRHKNLQFTLETPNGSRDLDFTELNSNINEYRKIGCRWYQKAKDTRIIFIFRSCAPSQHKIIVI